MKVSERISSLRQENGISRQSLGNYLDVPEEQIAAWEAGRSTPDFDTVVKICQLFHISYDAFLSRQDDNAGRKNETDGRPFAQDSMTQEETWQYNSRPYTHAAADRSESRQRLLLGVVLFLLGFAGNMIFFALSEKNPLSIQIKNVTFSGFLGYILGNHFTLIFLVCVVFILFGLIVCVREIKNGWRGGR